MVARSAFFAVLLSALLVAETAALPSRGALARKVSKRACSASSSSTVAPTSTPAPDPATTTTDAPPANPTTPGPEPEDPETSSPAEPSTTPSPEPSPEPVPAPPAATIERTLPWSTLNWPLPKKVIVIPEDPDAQWGNTERSLAGLAAHALKDNADVPLLWIGKSDARNLQLFLKRTNITSEEVPADLLKLLPTYMDLGVVKGYITYHYEDKWAEFSLNLATSLAAPMGAIVLDERYKDLAEGIGLHELWDARGKTFDDLQNSGKEFNKEIMTYISPIGGVRDMAVATNSWTAIDQPNAGWEKGLDYVNPAATIIGYPSDEHNGVIAISERGKGLVASDWLTNWPLLAAGPTPEMPPLKPENRTVFTDDGNSTYVAFVLTDGDNLAFTVGDGISGFHWWSNPSRGKIPFTWGLPISAMYQTTPDVYQFYHDTQTPNDAFMDWSDNYAYLERLFDKQGGDVLTNFIQRAEPFMDTWDNAPSQSAYDVVAKAAPDATSLVALQYSPYSAGQGRHMFGNRDDGSKLPVLTSLLSLWAVDNGDEFIGNPDYVAGKLDEVASNAAGKPLIDRIQIILVHAWSAYKGPEDMKDIARDDGEMGGYDAAMWCARRMTKGQKLVNMYDIEDMFKAAPPS
ncbi:hypothetical protein BKA62DRAFT_720464 [Auriculariales sp. MPI-PUGE-AT-0066]|nr:hypothetical protein BKA62DRAFT_720464 [Auriculariales sp. MPI-PUGE-AT-0066]